MEFSLLADEPSAADTVAQWYFDQWCKESGRYPLEFVHEKVSSATSRLGPPLIVLARQGGELVGAAELKIREMDNYPQFEFWLGGVYVAESARGRGIASALVTEVKQRAREAGIDRLYLQTEELSGGVYCQQGFEPIEQADSKGIQVLVMGADLAI